MLLLTAMAVTSSGYIVSLLLRVIETTAVIDDYDSAVDARPVLPLRVMASVGCHTVASVNTPKMACMKMIYVVCYALVTISGAMNITRERRYAAIPLIRDYSHQLNHTKRMARTWYQNGYQ